MNTVNKKKMRNASKKTDLFTVNREWVYENYDQLIKLINERVLDELDPTIYESDDREFFYNKFAVLHCAKVVGELFGLDIEFYETDDKVSMIEYDEVINYFSFNMDFNWILVGEYPEQRIKQDKRILKLAQTKREEFIEEFHLRERIDEWFDDDWDTIEQHDEFLHADDAEFIRLYFGQMDETMEYLIDKMYCSAIKRSIHSS